jgi:anti-anti-sigma factor
MEGSTLNHERSGGRIARTVDAGALTIEVVPNRGGTAVRLVGELDVSTINAVDHELRRTVADSNDSVTVDLDGLEFIDAAGIACLLRAIQGPRRRPLVRFRRPPAAIARILAMASVSDLLPYAD